MLTESLRYIDKRGRESKHVFHGKIAFEAAGALGGLWNCELMSRTAEVLCQAGDHAEVHYDYTNDMKWMFNIYVPNLANIHLSREQMHLDLEYSWISEKPEETDMAKIKQFENALLKQSSDIRTMTVSTIERQQNVGKVAKSNLVTKKRVELNDVNKMWKNISEDILEMRNPVLLTKYRTPCVFDPSLLFSRDLLADYPNSKVTTISFLDVKNYKIRIELPGIGLFIVTRLDKILDMDFYHTKETNAKSTFDERLEVLELITDEETIDEAYSRLVALTDSSDVTKLKLEFAEVVHAEFLVKDFADKFFESEEFKNYELKTLFYEDSHHWQFMVTIQEYEFYMTCCGNVITTLASPNYPKRNEFMKAFIEYAHVNTIEKRLESDEGQKLQETLARPDIIERIKAVTKTVKTVYVAKPHENEDYGGKLKLTSPFKDVQSRISIEGHIWASLTHSLCGAGESEDLFWLGVEVPRGEWDTTETLISCGTVIDCGATSSSIFF